MKDNELGFNDDAGWVEAELIGDYLCPDCKSLMMVVSKDTWGYAFCVKCHKYWKSSK